jgi:CheY-like chemotaxis protein
MKTVLIIDDSDEFRETVRYLLESDGLDVHESDCPEAAFRMLETIEPPDLIVCDLHMPFTTDPVRCGEFETSFEVGVKAVHELAWVFPDVPVVAMTSAEQIDITRIRRYLAPIPTYQKPDRILDLCEILRCHLNSQEWGGFH